MEEMIREGDRDRPVATAARDAGATTMLPGWVRWARYGYLVLAWILAGCVAAQVFFAGMATFVDSARWLWHTNFVHAFEYLPILMLLVAFAARLPVAMRWLSAALYALIFAQYATANIGGVPGAFHPVNALIIFWVSIHLGQRAWRVIREGTRVARPAAEVVPSGAVSPRA
jgi:hypothetical protein